jgi:hypothetical protein
MPIRKAVKKTAKNAATTAASALSAASETASTVGGKAIEAASSGASKMASNAQKKRYESRIARYNPIFPEEFFGQDYDLPNVIIIADGDERKGIDVCEGAIGWLSVYDGMEMLHLYEEAVPSSGLNFYPAARLNAAYFIDSLCGERFLDLDSYHEIVQKEKMTELKNIARSLGAKECFLETYEEDRSTSSSKKSVGVSVKHKTAGNVSSEINQEAQGQSFQSRSIIFEQSFEGSDNPKAPNLNYFKNDTEILSLIESRLSRNNRTSDYSLKLNTVSSSAMTTTTAAKIDGGLKAAKVKATANFAVAAEQESKRKLIFHVVF